MEDADMDMALTENMDVEDMDIRPTAAAQTEDMDIRPTAATLTENMDVVAALMAEAKSMKQRQQARRPLRGKAFTGVLLMLLVVEAHGLVSYKNQRRPQQPRSGVVQQTWQDLEDMAQKEGG